MRSYKQAVKPFAEPVTQFGLNKIMLQLFIVAQGKQVESCLQIHGKLRSQSYLHTQVGCQSQIIEKIVFHGYILSIHVGMNSKDSEK